MVRDGCHGSPLLPHGQATGQDGLDGREKKVLTQKEFTSACVLMRYVRSLRPVEKGGDVVRWWLAGKKT